MTKEDHLALAAFGWILLLVGGLVWSAMGVRFALNLLGVR